MLTSAKALGLPRWKNSATRSHGCRRLRCFTRALHLTVARPGPGPPARGWKDAQRPEAPPQRPEPLARSHSSGRGLLTDALATRALPRGEKLSRDRRSGRGGAAAAKALRHQPMFAAKPRWPLPPGVPGRPEPTWPPASAGPTCRGVAPGWPRCPAAHRGALRGPERVEPFLGSRVLHLQHVQHLRRCNTGDCLQHLLALAPGVTCFLQLDHCSRELLGGRSHHLHVIVGGLAT